MINRLGRLRSGLPSLKRLAERTPRKSFDRPQLQFRLGQAFVDLSDEARRAAGEQAGTARCDLLAESSEALANSREALEDVGYGHPEHPVGAEVLIWLAALSFPEEPERSVELLEHVIELSQSSWQARGRVALAEILLTAPSPIRDRGRAARELERVAPESRGSYFLAQHRLAELAWLGGDTQTACKHLRQIASTTWKENLSYVCGEP